MPSAATNNDRCSGDAVADWVPVPISGAERRHQIPVKAGPMFAPGRGE